MKLITRNTDYAIRALLVLADKEGEYVSAREIAEEQDIPYEYVRKILQELIKEKMVVSKEGGKGGFRLTRLRRVNARPREGLNPSPTEETPMPHRKLIPTLQRSFCLRL
jgi:predicted ArsR family transcriptional regulator